MQPLLTATDLHKRFGNTLALRGVSLRLMPGEAHGLVGENGAGKSSLLKIITGIYRPDSGSMSLAGGPFAPGGRMRRARPASRSCRRSCRSCRR